MARDDSGWASARDDAAPARARPRPVRWGRLLALPTALLALLILPFEVTDLDLAFSQPFVRGDPPGFPLKSDWLFHGLLHSQARALVVATCVALLLLALAGWRSPRWRAWVGPALYLALCVGLSTSLVQLLKPWTNRYSPWSFQEFGGPVPFTPLFSGTPEPFHGGRSFPAAHAMAGFAWIGLYHVARRVRIERPWRWLAPGLALGWLFAWAQHVRGAHLLSHDLWSLLLAWVLTTLLAWLFSARGWWGRPPGPAGWRRAERWTLAVPGACVAVGLVSVGLVGRALDAPGSVSRGWSSALLVGAAVAGGWLSSRGLARAASHGDTGAPLDAP